MRVLVNFIHNHIIILQNETVAQRNPVIPRKGETVEIDAWCYEVERVTHKFNTDSDKQVVRVYLKG